MVLESTMICVDNSEYMRNGDYVPTRLQAQQDAVNTICRFKLRSNPENNVGLLTLANTEVLATLTTDVGKILTPLHKVLPNGNINLLTGIRIAHLALKHRQSKNHKMRIVAFVGSPVEVEEKEIVKVAKRLKKEKVNIDIINFGETDMNQTLLESLVSTINGREGGSSHLVTVPPSPHLADALLSSPIVQGEDGAPAATYASGGGFEFGVDPNEDPELALALRVSMEEQRQRQQEEERRVAQESAKVAPMDTTPQPPTTTPTPQPAAAQEGVQSEEEMLQQALAMSLEAGRQPQTGSGTPASAATTGSSGKAAAATTTATAATATTTTTATTTSTGPTLQSAAIPDFSTMTEEEQIAYAMQISMQDCKPKEEPMDVDAPKAAAATPSEALKVKKEEEEQDFSQVMADPAFLESVLQTLPGVDPQSQVVKEAVGSLTQQEKDKDKDKKDKKKDDKQ
ncbi:26S proteasome non-ATPase regulatory subunit 4-like isoform X2 [Portunus trituberculatus]|uniref:26S proteasome non-ATPase regulatory subunit 4-like isoform X2 n=1 Tax=Portunus trituberculatus TaxID=210409 RepID=UPI001E1D18BA|nr:26S proteasome non-ATPase regulatory subunit 4-like isoform X2 [Portunus trituberculatus]